MDLPTIDEERSKRSAELSGSAPAGAAGLQKPARASDSPGAADLADPLRQVGRPGEAGPPASIQDLQKQRWAERLEKAENQPSSREELKSRLNHFERGHPSSPWREDGTPKPPVPLLSDLERQAPPLTDADYKAHVRDLVEKLERARADGLQTERLHALGPDHQEWSVERVKIHRSIINEVWGESAGVPSEHKAIMAGGLGGAGKTTVLADHAGVDRSQYLTIDPDRFKEKLAARGLVPEVPGLSPMEATSLAHEESSYLSRQLALRAIGEGKNLIWDITMSSVDSAERRISELHGAGYEVKGIFVDIPIEASIERTEARHRRGCDLFLNGQDMGGRYVPAEVIRAQKDTEFGSVNRRVFETLKDQFNNWAIYDNSVEGRAAVLVEASQSPKSRRTEVD